MKYLLLICFLLLVTSDALSQNAFDSSCYYPEMGNPNELDTIYGGQSNQGLGDDVKLFPPLKGQGYERLVMLGLPGNIPFLTAVETGPTFDLHKLKTSKKYPYIFEKWPKFKIGHFRSPNYTDISVMLKFPQGHQVTINLFDLLGREVPGAVSVESTGTTQTVVYPVDFPSGSYFMYIKAGGSHVTVPVVIQNR